MDEVKRKKKISSVDIEESAKKFSEMLEKISKDPETIKFSKDLKKKFRSISIEDIFNPFTI